MSNGMRCERSPLATASITPATAVVGRIRSAMSVLTDSTLLAHEPTAPATRILWLI